MSRHLAAVLCFLWLYGPGWAQTLHRSGRPTESPHTAGPHGLEGWTLDWPLPDRPNDGGYPFTLVIARRGHVLRKIEGAPFVWRWIFWADGKQVAYEAGPLHFGMACKLIEVTTGRQLADIDCFHGVPEGSPGWEKALENSR